MVKNNWYPRDKKLKRGRPNFRQTSLEKKSTRLGDMEACDKQQLLKIAGVWNYRSIKVCTIIPNLNYSMEATSAIERANKKINASVWIIIRDNRY